MWRGPIGNVNSGENGCRKMHNFALSLTVMGSLKIFLLPPPLFFLGGRELFHPLETHAVCFPPFSLTLGLRPPRGEASYAGLCLHPPPQPAQGGEEGQGPWGPRRRVLQGSWAWREREGHGRGQSHARLLQEVWAGLAAYHSGISSRVTPSRKLSLMSLSGVIVPNAIVYFLCSPYRYPKLICSYLWVCVCFSRYSGVYLFIALLLLRARMLPESLDLSGGRRCVPSAQRPGPWALGGSAFL